MKAVMFREVNLPAHRSISSRWKSITICTGASASTLQDIKVPESCGGYAYNDSGVASTGMRNRFIYWRTYQDVLELVEESLDMTLSGNMVRYRFQDTPILPKVTVQEVHGNVVVLVATVASVHRLIFPHPSRMSRQSFVLAEHLSTSIFYDASLPDDPKHQYLLNPSGSINSHLVGGHSCVCNDGHALFALATNTGGILMVKMPPPGTAGGVIQQELSCSSVMKKLWNGLIPGAMKSGQVVGETAVSLQIVSVRGELYIFTVCRDFRMRVWSVKTKECILVENILDYTCQELDEGGVSNLPNAAGHVLKMVQGSSDVDLCIYLSMQNMDKFVFLNAFADRGRLRFEHTLTVNKSSSEDLVDFVVTRDNLLALCTSQTGDTQVLTTSLNQSDEAKDFCLWEPVLLSPTPENIVVPQHRDPRDFFLNKIFEPGLFSPRDIIRALNVYQRSAVPALDAEMLYNTDNLKEEVANAVDTEIRNSASDYEMREEAYTQLQYEQWEKLYSCCVQYKKIGEKAKGLFTDSTTGMFAVIRKSTFSLLRPCARTEELYLSPTARLSETEVDRAGLASDDISPAQFAKDVRLVSDAVQLINSNIPQDAACMFLQCLQSSHPPEELIEKLNEMICMDTELTETLAYLLDGMEDFVNTVETLYNLLDISDDSDLDMMDGTDQAGHQHYSHLFCGELGVSILTQSFHQIVSLRLNFVRDLTLLITFANSHQVVEDRVLDELLPKGVYLLRCYKVLVWAAEALGTICPNSTLDYNLHQLNSLEITDSGTRRMQGRSSTQPKYLVQMFLEGVGGEQIRHKMASLKAGSNAIWREDLGDFLHSLSLLIWPAADDTILPEFLARCCQYLRLEEYIQLLDRWCTWNEGSRAFFKGLAYLHFDEPLKAVKLFVEASDGVATETFLAQKLLQTEETEHYKLIILYYLKVIKLMEEHGLSDLVISMATEAIEKALPDDPNLPTLISKVFKQHLELGHNNEAFTAMMKNPDPERKKDCLRQFLVVLCERGHLSDLVSFEYSELEDEVVRILENRARAVDLSTHDYYSLLFSYFVHREDYRKAGRVMFERGFRLAQEVPGLRSLQQQAQCFLATLNTLRLVKPEYAWIVKPASLSKDDGGGKQRTPKHDAEGRPKDKSKTPTKVVILELADLEKEYLLLDARLRLIRNNPDTGLDSGPMPSPEEILSLLCSAGLYDVAMSVTKAFSLSVEPILSSLGLRCVSLATSGVTSSGKNAIDSQASAWHWLRENNIPPSGAKECTASDKAWSLLQSYLSILEDGSGEAHRCVAFTLLSQSFHLPTWLIKSFKRLDVASLLRVYLTFDLTPQAASLAMEYLEAATNIIRGMDEPAFNLKSLDRPTPMGVWVPYTCLDQLLVALRDQGSPLYEQLENKLKIYQAKSFEMSQQITAY